MFQNTKDFSWTGLRNSIWRKHSHFFLRSDQCFLLHFVLDRQVFLISPCQNKNRKQQMFLLLIPIYLVTRAVAFWINRTAVRRGIKLSEYKTSTTQQTALTFNLKSAAFHLFKSNYSTCRCEISPSLSFNCDWRFSITLEPAPILIAS